MKRILIVTIALMMLCSCAGTTDKDPVSQSQNDTTTASYTRSEEVVSVESSEATSAESDETTSVESSEATTAESTENAIKMPDRSFIGVWSTDEFKANQILIWEITEDSVKFNAGVSGLFGFDAFGVILNGEIAFGDGISPYYSGPDGVKGRLEFSDSGITVIYDDFGSVPDAEYYPNRYTFTIKDENSDDIIEQYKSSMQDLPA